MSSMQRQVGGAGALVLVGALVLSPFTGFGDWSEALPLLQEAAVLTDAPNVPPPITRTRPARVTVHLETREVTKHLADGVEYTFWTSVAPGSGRASPDSVETSLAAVATEIVDWSFSSLKPSLILK